MLELCTNLHARTKGDANGLAIRLSYHIHVQVLIFRCHIQVIQHNTVLTFVSTQTINFVLFFGFGLGFHRSTLSPFHSHSRRPSVRKHQHRLHGHRHLGTPPKSNHIYYSNSKSTSSRQPSDICIISHKKDKDKAGALTLSTPNNNFDDSMAPRSLSYTL
jgi:hypothetical protein